MSMQPQDEQTSSTPASEDPTTEKKPRKAPVGKKDRAITHAATGELPALTKRQKYAEGGQRVAMYDLVPYPSNPRVMDHIARAKLSKEVQRGLVSRPTWNLRTKHIVGGHQRIDALRELEGECPACHGKKLSLLWKAIRLGKPWSKDFWLDPDKPIEEKPPCEVCHGCGYFPFSLDVDMIDVDLIEEKRLNVALNNSAMQGQFEVEKLTQILHDMTDSGMSLLDTGFEPMDLELVGVMDERLLQLHVETEAGEKVVADLDEIKKLKELKKEHKKKDRERETAEVFGQIVIACTPAEKKALKEKLLLKENEDFVLAWRVLAALGIRLEDEEPAPANSVR